MYLVYSKYDELLKSYAEAGYKGISVLDAAKETKTLPLLILRHDIEWNPNRALAFAQIEKKYGFRSTFSFRVDTNAYDLPLMHKLQDDGFEISYHFNTLDRCKGNFEKAIMLFEEELRELRKENLDIQLAIRHGDPRVKKNGYRENSDIFDKDPNLFKRNNLLDVGPILKERYQDYIYLADYGVRWTHAATTKELIGYVKEKRWPEIYMLTHPDYWSGSIIRAIGLQVAGRCLRAMPINAAIASCKHVITALRTLLLRQ